MTKWNPPDLAARVGSSVQTLRKARKLTQAELAEVAGTTSVQISRIERGAQEPKFGTVSRLASALGVDAEVLFQRPKGGKTPVRRRSSRIDALEAALRELDPAVAEAALDGCLGLVRGLRRRRARRK